LTSVAGYVAVMAALCTGAVVGFLSFLPSGAVVRELVVMVLLSPLVGEPLALLAAVLMRVVSLIAEFTVIGSVYLLSKIRSKKES
jgi:glycosyltransferase 2 family protein